jgi:hypothetical protein
MQSKKYIAFKAESNFDGLRALFIIYSRGTGSFSHVEDIIDRFEGIRVDVVIVSSSPYATLAATRDSKLRTRSVILTDSFSRFGIYDKFGYSFVIVMDQYADPALSDIREAISKSLSERESVTIKSRKSGTGPNIWLRALDRFGVDQKKPSDIIPDLIKCIKNETGSYPIQSLMSAYPTSCSRDEIIFISFYTTDEYYTKTAEELKYSLDRLGVKHDIVPFTIPAGMKWPEICRRKVSFYSGLLEKHKDSYKKIVWIDADCKVNYLPSFILDFDVDFMAFRRGFPHSTHLDKSLTRHWEPCFFVFKSGDKCSEMLRYASELEINSPEIKATDDYFFEEAWRKFGGGLNVFEIPGEMSSRGYKSATTNIEARTHGVFFSFGDSGNVPLYKGKVLQHEKIAVPIKTRIEVKKINGNPLEALMKSARNARSSLLDPNETFGRGIAENDRELVRSIFSYEIGGKSIKLNWWIRPAPGNMGDWLSPYIVHKITGSSVSFTPAAKAKLISLGSIGRYIGDSTTVWGTGISSRDTQLSKSARYLAVRGPHTADAIKKSGGTPPKVLGDPGIIMPSIYSPKTKKSEDYGFVRHFVHQGCSLNIENGIRDINILLSSPVDIENFIDQIYECKAIVTTSLHVLILCISYRIPCRLISVTEQGNGVHGDGIKYRDFYEGVGISPKSHADFGDLISRSKIEGAVQDDHIDSSLIDDFKAVFLKDFSSNPDIYC